MAKMQPATFEYLQWKDVYEREKPYEILIDDLSKLGDIKRTNLEFKEGPEEQVEDVRGSKQEFTLDTHGFTWVHDKVEFEPLGDEDSILSSYIPTVEKLLRKEIKGADRVVIFDWRLRISSADEVFKRKTIDLNNNLDPLRPAVHPHIDQTAESSLQRAFHHLNLEAEQLLKGRFRIINDFVRRNYAGETYFAMYKHTYKWYFLSQQQPDEILLFKIYDSAQDVGAKYCVHASFPMKDPESRQPRESIECRALVLSDPIQRIDRPTSSSFETPNYPYLTYGTAWKGSQTLDLVSRAIDAGFRGFDTAAQPKNYNENLVGKALREAISNGKAQRSDLWIQTKFSNLDSQDPGREPYDPTAPISDQVSSSICGSLANLGFCEEWDQRYLDCVLIHAPFATIEETLEAWEALSSFVPTQVRSLGICNVPISTLAMLWEKSRIKPSVVQNRFAKSTRYDAQVRAFCKSHGIIYQGFGVIKCNQDLLNTPVVLKVATDAQLSPEQALFNLVRALGVHPLNGTTHSGHMLEYIVASQIFDDWRGSEANIKVWSSAEREFDELLHML